MARTTALGRAVDATLLKHPAAAEPIAREEYELYLEAERLGGKRLHKGHPLHNVGVAIYAIRTDEARTYFHAAHAEDVRTYGTEDPGLLARRMLLDLFGEPVTDLEELAELARASDEDPLTLARRFEDAHGPFAAYIGLSAGWRKESDLDPYGAHQLVFCAGAHSQPDRLKAIADGVRDAGLQPVIVMEFENLEGENEYAKSLRLLDRCALAAFDMSAQSGQLMEMTIAERSGKPFFYGYVSNDPLEKPHGSRMPQGAAASAGTKPTAFRSNEELRALVRAWAERAGPMAALTGESNYLRAPGLSARQPLGSNFTLAPPLPEQPPPMPSGGSAHVDFGEDEWPEGKQFEFIFGDDEKDDAGSP
jgi:hypothetical protein